MLLARKIAAITILGILALCASLGPIGSVADPTERLSTSDDAEQVNLTIYNGSQSLVHDRRRVVLDSGINNIAWRDVSGNMDPASALLDDLTSHGSVSVVEQNFNFDLLSPKALLDKYVGQSVIVVHDRPMPGRPQQESARLLSDNADVTVDADGNQTTGASGVVLQYAHRVETGLYDSHIIFPAIPANLRDRPTLVLRVDAAHAGAQDLDLSYLTDGLSWQADYVGVVSPNDDRMQINGLVTLSNTTGTTFPNARLQLVAGNVNQAVRPQPQLQAQHIEDMAMAGAPAMTQENYFEYHLYTLGRPTTVANAQTKQVSLLSARDVPIHKTLELRGSDGYYHSRNGDLGTKLKFGVYITFTNKGGDLGVPLPGGIFRLYKSDSQGTSQFLGSDNIDHTPRDQDVRLHVGDSFDVTATKKQTNFQGVGSCQIQSSYEIAVSNAKDEAQEVQIIEPIPGVWSIPSENFPHTKTSSSTATWTITVPARETTTLKYTALVKYCF